MDEGLGSIFSNVLCLGALCVRAAGALIAYRMGKFILRCSLPLIS